MGQLGSSTRSLGRARPGGQNCPILPRSDHALKGKFTVTPQPNNVSKEPNPTQLNSTQLNPNRSPTPLEFGTKVSNKKFKLFIRPLPCMAWHVNSRAYKSRILCQEPPELHPNKRCRKGGFSSLNYQGKMVLTKKRWFFQNWIYDNMIH